MFPCSSNVHNPFPHINSNHYHSNNIRPESNFSMTTNIGHEINPINFQTLIDHHHHHHHQEDGLLLSHLLSHRIEEDRSLEVVPNRLEDTKGILMKKKTKTKTKTKTTTVNVPIRKGRTGKKDRHSKIFTAQGLRDRRMRLSLQIARKFFHLQDMLGFDKASKTIEWLFLNSKSAIEELIKENVSLSPPGHEQNCKMVNSSSANSETTQALSAAADEKEEEEEEEEEEEDHGDEEKKRKRRKQKLCRVVGKESREKARERARERTRQKMKIRGGGGLDQEMNVHSYDCLKTVCEVEDHQPGIDELLAAADHDDQLHVINSNCWANSEEDFPGYNWNNSNKMQCFSCTITNTDLDLRFTAAAAAPPPGNYSVVFPNPRSDDDHIHHTQQQQNPSFVNNITTPIFLTSTLIAQADHQQNPSSNSIWQSQFLENQYFNCNPITSNKNHISY